jgi:predicted transcriptional regulator
MTISIQQIKAARALLRISVFDLADISNLSSSTIKRLEAQNSEVLPRDSTMSRIKIALESQGIEFLGTPEKDPGVRLKSL